MPRTWYLLLLTALIPLSAATIATEQTVNFSDYGGAAQTLALRAWVPDGVTAYRGVLFILPGNSSDTRTAANDGNDVAMQVVAARHGFILIGALYSNGTGTSCGALRTPPAPYTQVSNLTGVSGNADVLFQGVHQFAQALTHPELDAVPLALWGMSNGSGLAVHVAATYPARVVAFAHNKGISYPEFSGIDDTVLPPSDSSWSATLSPAYPVPGLICYGELDVSTTPTSNRAPAIKLAFKDDRGAGALWGMIPDWGLGHDYNGYGHYFGAVFLDRMIERRIPATWVPGRSASYPTLVALDEASGWAANDATVESPLAAVAPVASLADLNVARTRSWFADEELARSWQAIATHQPVVKLGAPTLFQVLGSGASLTTTLASTSNLTQVSWFDGLTSLPAVPVAPWSNALQGVYGLHPVRAQVQSSTAVQSVTNLGIVVTKRTSNLAPVVVTAPTVGTASAYPNVSIPLSLVAADADGGLEQVLTYTWSLVSGPGSAVFSAANGTNAGKNLTVVFSVAGAYVLRVTVTDLEGLTQAADLALTVLPTPSAPTVAVSAACNPSPVIGTTAGLSVLGADNGGEAALTYTWSATGTPPGAVTFTSNGTNAAKSTTVTFTTAGVYPLQVAITDAGGLTTTSNLTVTVVPTLTSISVSPGSVTIANRQTQQFTAVARDQFGMALAPQPSLTWSMLSGAGAVDAGGIYTAPTSGTGSAVVQAADGAVVITANVTIDGGGSTAGGPGSSTTGGGGGGGGGCGLGSGIALCCGVGLLAIRWRRGS
jgi:hypothetical protein